MAAIFGKRPDARPGRGPVQCEWSRLISTIPSVNALPAQLDPTLVQPHGGHGGGHRGQHVDKVATQPAPAQAKPTVRRPNPELIKRIQERQEQESDGRRRRYQPNDEQQEDETGENGRLVDFNA